MTWRDRRLQSIERKLPLVMSGLLLGTVVAFSWTAYERVGRILTMAAAARMQSASTVVGLLLEQSVAHDKTQLAEVARDSAIAGFVATGAGREAARQALGRYPAEKATPRVRMELRDARGVVLADTTRGVAPPGSGWIEHEIAAATLLPGRAAFGPVRVSADSVYIESVVAVGAPQLGRGRPPPTGPPPTAVVGYVDCIQYLTPAGAEALRDLVGAHATVLVGSPADSVWTDFEHPAPPPPRDMRIGQSSVYRGPRGAVGVGAAVAVTGAPWVVWISQPREAVLAPMGRLLDEFGILAALFIIGGAVAGWLMSRRITRPLVALTEAAEQVAVADATPLPRVGDQRDEVARLAGAFGRMAERVAESRQELEMQVEEAQELAAELETTNDDLRAAIRAAEDAREAAQTANRVKSDFLAVMSHELRTPLNAILGYGELLFDGVCGPISDDQREKLDRMRRSASELLQLVNQVLDLDRLGVAPDQLLPEATEIGTLVREAVAEVELRATERGLWLVVDTPDTPLVVVSDVVRLRQIVLNLLSNAVKYTERGGVHVRARAIEGALHLVVQDTGIGIPAEHRARIFEPFWQADQRLTRRVGGSGLGLAIVHRLTRLLGGEITVESTLGEGSTFTVRLPLSVAPYSPPS
jgi:signal transduction histidine kinase